MSCLTHAFVWGKSLNFRSAVQTVKPWGKNLQLWTVFDWSKLGGVQLVDAPTDHEKSRNPQNSRCVRFGIVTMMWLSLQRMKNLISTTETSDGMKFLESVWVSSLPGKWMTLQRCLSWPHHRCFFCLQRPDTATAPWCEKGEKQVRKNVF